MSLKIPNLPNACIAANVFNNTNGIYLIGSSPEADEGVIFIYSVNLNNLNSPNIVYIVNTTDLNSWRKSLTLACVSYPSSQRRIPITIYQTGYMPFAASFYPEYVTGGDYYPDYVTESVYYNGQSVFSPSLFSVVGTQENSTWVVALTNNTNRDTISPWAGFRFNSANISHSMRGYNIYAYPNADPLVSVGASSDSSNPNIKGYHVVFDKVGHGSIYSVVELNSTDAKTVVLSDRYSEVNMASYTFSSHAVTMNMGQFGYILDMSVNSTIDVYFINPSSSDNLQRHIVTTPVPPFLMNMAVTSLNNEIVVYGFNTNLGMPVFNTFDTITATWKGPGLFIPTPSPTPSLEWIYSTSSSDYEQDVDISLEQLGIISGGALAGIALIGLIIFFIVQNRKRKAKKLFVNEPKTSPQRPISMASTIEAPLMEGDYLASQYRQSRTHSFGSQSRNSFSSIGSEFNRPLSLAGHPSRLPGPPLPERNYIDSHHRKSVSQFPGYQLPRGSIVMANEDNIESAQPEQSRTESTIGVPIMEGGNITSHFRHSMAHFSGESQGDVPVEHQANTTRPYSILALPL